MDCGLHLAIPGKLTFQHYLRFPSLPFQSHAAAHIQMCVKRMAVLGIDIRSQRTHDSCDIRRTAGTSEPFLSHRLYMTFPLILFARFRQHLQGINIEKAFPVQCHTGQNRIVQRLLHHVPIPAVRLNLQHSSGKKGQSNGCTCLGICRIVGQIIRKRKCLSHMGSANAAGQVKFFVYNAVPQPLTCRQHLLVLCKSGHIRHTAVKIYPTYRMSHRLRLFPHRQVGLMILKPQRL